MSTPAREGLKGSICYKCKHARVMRIANRGETWYYGECEVFNIFDIMGSHGPKNIKECSEYKQL